METLLDDLLAYSRAGRQRHQRQIENIFDLVHEVIEMLSPPSGFRFEISSSLPTMSVERTPLELVFRNLIGNAIKHHDQPDEGLIVVDAK